MERTQLIPDANGSICLSGQEGLADEFLTKDRFLKSLQAEVERLKDSLRAAARMAVGQARTAGAEKVARVFIPGSLRGGISVSLPDYSKEGNRLSFSDEKLGELTRAEGLESIGLAPELVFEELRDPGGETVTLRGKWAAWFVENYKGFLSTKDPDISWEKREPSVVRRLKVEAITQLETLAANGMAVAAVLLARGLKAMMVRGEQ